MFYNAIIDEEIQPKRYIAVTSLVFIDDLLDKMSDSFIDEGFQAIRFKQIPKSLLLL